MIKSTILTCFSRIISIVAICLLVVACANPEEDIDAAGLDGTVTPGTVQDFFVNVGDRVYFAVDSSILNGIALNTLNQQAQWLNQYPQFTITIEGHADERGTRQYNLALGARRAAAVRDYLIGQGISGNRIETISFGKERPEAICNDESCWSQNRRGVTVVNNSSA